MRRAAWVLVLSLSGAVAVVRAEINASCSRCGKWVKLSDEGAGFARNWEGLCGTCVDPRKRCDDAIKDLERRIAELREAVAYWTWVIEHPDGGGAPGDRFTTRLANAAAVATARSRLSEAESNLAAAIRRLEAMKAECAARAGGGAGDVADAARDLLNRGAKGVASQLRNTVEAAYRNAKVMNEQIAGTVSRVADTARNATAAPTAAAQLDAIEHYMRSLVGSSEEPAPAGSVGSEATAEGSPVASQDEILKPDLVDLQADLPAAPVEKGLALSERHARNAAAYADALRKSVDQVEAARAAGDAKRARKHLDRAAYLASMGQKSLRQSVADRTAAVQALYHETTSFERAAKGKTVEEALAAWQAEVRMNGLPADYLAALRKAGVSEEGIAKHQEWLVGVDAKAAAETQAAFVALVAPRYVPAARGKADAPLPLPEADDLWDLVTIMLLEPADPAAGGAR